MDKSQLRIVFMGTPEFAVESLQRLVEGGYHVVAVITMPDKAVGRHASVLQQSPVKQYALSRDIPVLQPEKLKDPEFIEQLRSFRADLQIVVAFRMLPEVVWAMPRLGTFNVHAALLPQYRGAAPINWAVINGETETGVTTFFLTHDIDTGSIIRRERVPVLDTDNVENVYDKLMHVGAELCVSTVDDILAGHVDPRPQSEFVAEGEVLHPAPKIFKETCRIAWKEKTAKQVYDFIRGLSPYPAAWTELHPSDDVHAELSASGAATMKIYRAAMDQSDVSRPAGTIESDGKHHIWIYASDGRLDIQELQLAGKKRMDATSFINGNRDIESYYAD